LYYNNQIDKGGGRMEVTLSPKYQLVVPKKLREKLNLKKGQKFNVIVKNGVIIYTPEIPLKEMKGILKDISIEGIREEGDRV